MEEARNCSKIQINTLKFSDNVYNSVNDKEPHTGCADNRTNNFQDS